MAKREYHFDYERFNREMDMENLAKELNKGRSSGDYKTVPYDKYEVSLNKLVGAETKNGDPKMMVDFVIHGGEYNSYHLFWHLVLTNDKRLGIAKDFLKSLEVYEDDEIQFTGDIRDFLDLISDMGEDVGNKRFLLDYYDHNGYPAYRIVKD